MANYVDGFAAYLKAKDILSITVGFPVNSFGGFNYFSAQLRKDVLNWAGNGRWQRFKRGYNPD